jgi:hypothetical protein
MNAAERQSLGSVLPRQTSRTTGQLKPASAGALVRCRRRFVGPEYWTQCKPTTRGTRASRPLGLCQPCGRTSPHTRGRIAACSPPNVIGKALASPVVTLAVLGEADHIQIVVLLQPHECGAGRSGRIGLYVQLSLNLLIFPKRLSEFVYSSCVPQRPQWNRRGDVQQRSSTDIRFRPT